MANKAPDIYRDQRDKRRRAYTLSPLLREEFPQLEQISFELKFTDPAGVGHHSQQTHTLGASARAYFMVSCPFSTCVDGGFDLSRVVADMVARKHEVRTGKMICQGWHDRNRVGEHRCLLELQYTVSGRYVAPLKS